VIFFINPATICTVSIVIQHHAQTSGVQTAAPNRRRRKVRPTRVPRCKTRNNNWHRANGSGINEKRSQYNRIMPLQVRG